MDETGNAWSAELSSLIAVIGEPSLAVRLLTLLHRIFGADHAAVFHLHSDRLEPVAAASIDGTDLAERQVERYLGNRLWRSDPAFAQAEALLAQDRFTLLHTDIAALEDENLRDQVYLEAGIRDRVLLCGRMENDVFGLSVLRGRGSRPFSERELRGMRDTGEVLLAILARHARFAQGAPDVGRALTTLSEIETCIGAAPEAFPRREAEVCSRIVYGISTLGIALELEISEETVMTYRKRAYHRIGIATQRELLVWYLERWSEWAGRRNRRVALA